MVDGGWWLDDPDRLRHRDTEEDIKNFSVPQWLGVSWSDVV